MDTTNNRIAKPISTVNARKARTMATLISLALALALGALLAGFNYWDTGKIDLADACMSTLVILLGCLLMFRKLEKKASAPARNSL